MGNLQHGDSLHVQPLVSSHQTVSLCLWTWLIENRDRLSLHAPKEISKYSERIRSDSLVVQNAQKKLERHHLTRSLLSASSCRKSYLREYNWFASRTKLKVRVSLRMCRSLEWHPLWVWLLPHHAYIFLQPQPVHSRDSDLCDSRYAEHDRLRI